MATARFTFKKVGANIRSCRVNQQIKQDYLAKKTALWKSDISRIENGKRDLTVKNLLKIAEALRVHPCEFFQD